jgi:hypothetical protein
MDLVIPAQAELGLGTLPYSETAYLILREALSGQRGTLQLE